MSIPAIIAALACALSVTAHAACPPLLDFRVKDIDGQQQDLCAHAGRVVLVVNTASECGFTPQYKGLQAVYEQYRARGLVVLGFPANDFFGQESGSEREIKQFCETEYAVDFPLFSKVSVKKGRAQPLHEALFRATGERPGWNFHKYLIARDGKTALSFGTRTEPDGPALRRAIEAALARPAPAATKGQP